MENALLVLFHLLWKEASSKWTNPVICVKKCENKYAKRGLSHYWQR